MSELRDKVRRTSSNFRSLKARSTNPITPMSGRVWYKKTPDLHMVDDESGFLDTKRKLFVPQEPLSVEQGEEDTWDDYAAKHAPKKKARVTPRKHEEMTELLFESDMLKRIRRGRK